MSVPPIIRTRRAFYLNEADTRELVSIGDIIGFCEEAYRLYGQYQAGKIYANFSPMVSYPTQVAHSDVDYRSGIIEGIPTICSTLGWGFWDNPINNKLPSVSVLISLNDVKTGLPLCLMTGYYLGAARTGAAAGVCSKYLARGSSTSLGLIGSGSVARYMLASHVELFKQIDDVRVWSRTPKRREQFAKLCSKTYGIRVRPVESAREAVERMDIVCAAVPSREPIVRDTWIRSGVHINAFGADARGKQELDPHVLLRAKIVVDSLEQCKQGGEINVPLSQGMLGEDNVYAQIGEIANGWKPGRTSEDEITVMDSTGVSALDVVTYYRAFEKAAKKHIGTKISLTL